MTGERPARLSPREYVGKSPMRACTFAYGVQRRVASRLNPKSATSNAHRSSRKLRMAM
jgi:hypothetical protein